MWKFLRNILQLIISPDNGWSDIGKSKTGVHDLARRLLIVTTVSSLTALLHLMQLGHPSVVYIIQAIIVTVVSLWTAYFLGDFALTNFLKNLKKKVDENTISTFVTYSVALSSLQFLIQGLLPFTMAIVQLWPLYVLVVMWRGMDYLGIGRDSTLWYLLVITLSIIVPVQLITLGFATLLN